MLRDFSSEFERSHKKIEEFGVTITKATVNRSVDQPRFNRSVVNVIVKSKAENRLK